MNIIPPRNHLLYADASHVVVMMTSITPANATEEESKYNSYINNQMNARSGADNARNKTKNRDTRFPMTSVAAVTLKIISI